MAKKKRGATRPQLCKQLQRKGKIITPRRQIHNIEIMPAELCRVACSTRCLTGELWQGGNGKNENEAYLIVIVRGNMKAKETRVQDKFMENCLAEGGT